MVVLVTLLADTNAVWSKLVMFLTVNRELPLMFEKILLLPPFRTEALTVSDGCMYHSILFNLAYGRLNLGMEKSLVQGTWIAEPVFETCSIGFWAIAKMPLE